MANNIKYSSSPDLISLRSGNFSLGVDPSQEYAFTWQTDYFNGFEVKEGTYVIYTFNQFYLDLYNCAIKTYIAHSDEDLVAYLSTVRGEVMTGVKESLLWANSDPNVIVFSSSVIDTLTEGLVLDLDGSQEASLPRSGGGWYDLSINNYKPEFTGGVSYTDSGLRGLSFDGTTGYGRITTPTQRNVTSLTYEVWFKGVAGPAATGSWSYILHNSSLDTSVGNSYMFIGIEGVTDTYVASLNGESSDMSTGVTANDDNIYQLVLSWDGETQRVYLNGELKNSEALSYSTFPRNSNWDSVLGIGDAVGDGSVNPPYRSFDGDIYSIRAWERGLTAAEIQASYLARTNTAKLLDAFPGAAAAYSVRKLSSTYEGGLIRVRRSIDGTEADFFPDENGEISMNSKTASGYSLGNWIYGTEQLPADIGSGAAAGYSLRYVTDNNVSNTRRAGSYEDLGVAYSLRHVTNDYVGPVVRVRRDSDDAERDFYPWEITNGYLEEWTKNSSDADLLPADYGTGATAAFSLRYITERYRGPVVRVRRDVDDQERDFTPDQITSGEVEDWVGPSNLMTYSDTYSSWGGPNITLTTGQPDPFGGLGATLIAATNTGTVLERNISSSSVFERTEEWTISGYFKASGNDWVILRSNVDGNWRGAWFNIADGSVGTVQADISNTSIEYVRDGWYKCSVTFDGPRTSSVQLHTVLSDGTFGYNGNGTDGMLVTRVQVADGTSTGEYIETSNAPVYGDGYVTTWYNQVDTDKNAVQATGSQQPSLVRGSNLSTLFGKPSIYFDGTDDFLNAEDIGSHPEHSLSVVYSEIKAGDGYVYSVSYNTGTSIFMFNTAAYWLNAAVDQTSFLSGATSGLATGQMSGTTQTLYWNGESRDSKTTTFTGTSTLDHQIGYAVPRNNTSAYLLGNVSETVYYPTDQAANRESIDSTINDYYGIYSTTPNAYVTTWYDQSGNENHVTQATDTAQPLIVNDGVVNQVNGKAAVRFDGVDDELNNGTFSSSTTHIFGTQRIPSDSFSGSTSYLGLHSLNSAGSNRRALKYNSNQTSGSIYYFNGTTRILIDGPYSEQWTLSLLDDGSGTGAYSVDGEGIRTGTFGTNGQASGVTIGKSSGPEYSRYDCQELLIYTVDMTHLSAGIDQEMNQYYQVHSNSERLANTVIRVRRSIDDAEQDFTPQEVLNGTLQDWVVAESIYSLPPADYGSGAAAAYSLRNVSSNVLEGTRLPGDYASPTAAYSLRNVVSGYDGPVVRVRRTIDDDERDFTPTQINSGELAAWANLVSDEDPLAADYAGGAYSAYSLRKVSNSLQVPTNLPGDWGTGPAAAYSLRQVVTGYENAVVNIRRSSDDQEMPFTAREIADGTLVNWVSETVPIYISDFANGTAPAEGSSTFSPTAMNITAPVNSIGGRDNVCQFECDGVGDPNRYYNRIATGIDNGGIFNISFDYFIPSENSTVDGLSLADLTGFSPVMSTQGEWVSISGSSLVSNNNIIRIFAASSVDGTNLGPGVTESIYIDNLRIEQLNADGHVTVLYDQSSNHNDAVQETASEQPLIVETGVLVEENGKPAIQFDGVDDNLTAGSSLASELDINANTSINVVFSVNTAQTFNSIYSSAINSGNRQSFMLDSSNNACLTTFNGSSSTSKSGLVPTDTQFNVFNTVLSNTLETYQNGVQETGTTLGATNGTNSFAIGSEQDGTNPFNGAVQEILIYDSDQSMNREDIEFNTNQYYGIFDQWDRQSVVNVRRTIGTGTETRDFTPTEINNGTLERWVNGDLTLPGSRSSAKGVWSLRAAVDDYEGPVVRVRRSSDDAEKGFSAVEVADGTLLDWVTSPATVYESNFSSSNDSWAITNVALANGVTYEGVDDALEITLNSSGGAYQIARNNFFDTSKSYKIEFDYFLPAEGLTDRILVTGGTTIGNGHGMSKGAWYTKTLDYFVPSVISVQLRLQSGDGGNFYSDTGAKVYVKNIKLTELEPNTSDGAVTVWYDQSLTGLDLTQGADASQPLIVEGGALIKSENGLPAVKFDGSNSFMVSAANYPTGENISAFYVASSMGGNQRVLDTRGIGGSGTVIGWQTKFNNPSADVSLLDGGNVSDILTASVTRTGLNQATMIGSLTSLTDFTNGTQTSNDTGSLSSFNSGNPLYVGTNVNGQNQQIFEGTLQEIVLFDQDMTSERPLIEASQIWYYRTSQNDNNGVITTWYDQSGNNRHATQSTASQQPYIVRYGSLVKQNSSPGIFFDEVADQEFDLPSGTLTQWSTFLLLSILEPTIYGALLGAINEGLIFHKTVGGFCYDDNVQNYNSLVSQGDIPFNTQTLLSAHATGTTITGFDNSVEKNTVTPPGGDTDLALGTINGDFAGKSITMIAQEILIYDEDLETAGFRDGIEASIGYNYDTFNTSAEAHVTTWYDQSGNSNHATQETASEQPKIVENGSYVLNSGLPSISFDGTDDILELTNAIEVNQFSLFTSWNLRRANTDVLLGDVRGDYIQINNTTTIGYFNQGGSTNQTGFNWLLNNPSILEVVWDGNTYNSEINDGGDISTVLSGLSQKFGVIGDRGAGGGRQLQADINELILYDNSSLISINSIKSNIANYYDIGEAWDGQSVTRVRRSSDETERIFTADEVNNDTLLNWVNEEIIQYESDFRSSIDGWNASSSGLSDVDFDIDFENKWETLRLTTDGSTGQHFVSRLAPFFDSKNNVVEASAEVYIPSSNVTTGSVQIWTGFSGDGIVETDETDRWVPISGTITNISGSSLRIQTTETLNSTITYTATAGDVVYIKNFKITQTAANGFVTTLYDQSGNANHATQSTVTAQPAIVDGGILVKENNKPAIQFDGVDDRLVVSAFTSTLAQPNTTFIVNSAPNNTNDNTLIDGVDASNRNLLIANSNNYTLNAGTFVNAGVNSDTQSLVYTLWDGAGSEFATDGGSASVINTGTQGLTGLSIGTNFAGSNPNDGTIQELVIYNSDQSGNRQLIETNTNEYYGIYDQTVDGYVSALYNQKKYILFTSDYRFNVDGAIGSNTTLTAGVDVGGTVDSLQIEFSGGNVPHNIRPYSSMVSGRTYNIKFKYYIPNGSPIDELQVSDNVGGSISFTQVGIWSDAVIIGKEWGSTLFRIFPYSGGSNTIDSNGSSFYIKDVVIEEDGTLVSPEATQPLIVQDGLIKIQNDLPTITFEDGDWLRAPLPDYALADMYFVTQTTDTTYLYPDAVGSSSYGMVAEQGTTSGTDSGYGNPDYYFNGTQFTGTNRGEIYTTLGSTQNIVTHISASTTGWGGIGFSGYGGAYNFSGDLQEWIIYDSDTTGDRVAVESNINKYYDVYDQNVQGFVSTWYDQSGNGNHVLQETGTNQPRIVDNGTLILENELAAVEFDGTNTFLRNLNFSLDNTLGLGVFNVIKSNNTNTSQYIWATLSATDNRTNLSTTATGQTGFQFRQASIIWKSGATTTNQRLISQVADATTPQIYLDGVLGIGTEAEFNARVIDNVFYIGSNSAGAPNIVLNGTIQEIVLYNIDKSTVRTTIEDNINKYYSIYP